jgi:hypothetical protein
MAQDGEPLRFQRLERVRAQQRARRRLQLFLLTTLLIALTSAGLLAFTATRRTPVDRIGSPSATAPAEVLKPPAALPAATDSAFGPPSAVASPSTRADGVNRDATQPPRIRVETDRRARPPSDRPGRATAPSRNEPHAAESVDPAAAIDWLLKTSRASGR